ncbi:MAG: endonuclease/exonuclease/phosphatase family protein [Nitrospirota bacterium]|nr:endonuclease/exonuclease/phosphatase family protein [Nitrospirota bacterium]
MPIFFRAFCLTVFFFIFCSVVVWAKPFEIGQQVTLHAVKAIGVPIHREARPSFRTHVPDHSVATIQRINSHNHWLFLALESGEIGWVHPKYVRLTASSSPSQPHRHASTSAKPVSDEVAVWSSREQCDKVVSAGKHMRTPSTHALRVATWNLRWFPYGQSPDSRAPSTQKTDLSWLACTIAWMQVDIIAVQESLGTAKAKKAWESVTQSLRTTTGESWRWSPQPCGKPDGHHVGFLWNTNRVSLSEIHSLWSFNIKARSANTACEGGLRPGHYARVQSREQGGVDFHLIALHLKSGPTVFALGDRQKALNRIDKNVATLLAQDRDVLIVGDLNTMGAGDNASRRSELKYVRRMVAKEKPGFRDMAITPQCTHYFRGKGGWLDHILVSKGMQEITAKSAQVSGYCAVAHCKKISGDYPAAYRRLSDHCPVIVEIQDRDND